MSQRVQPPITRLATMINDALKCDDKAKKIKQLAKSKLAVCKLLATHCYNNKQFDTGIIRRYCCSIRDKVNEYAFQVCMGGNVAGDNFNAFVKSVYNMINYKKDNTEKDKKKQAAANRKKLVRDDATVDDPPMLFDEYGCAQGMWEPEIENPVNQEEKKKAIMEHYIIDEMAEQVKTLLRDTYALQRHFINRTKTKEQWTDLFTSWPVMLTTLFVYEHASLLLGKNVHSVWFKALEGANFFAEFMASYCADEEKKPSKSSQYMQMQNLLEEMNTAAQTERSNEPSAKAVVPLLVMYMKEKSTDLFVLLNVHELLKFYLATLLKIIFEHD
ncbi:uncharacterized protein [Linepithema humile]|uniref:uncharacterized protein isoform X2 n=1 Tax=Linepithema humile TaxID=83485 RepID=UPI00351E11A9